VNPELLTGVILAGGLLLFGVATLVYQVRGLKRLKATAILPSDERSYFRSRYRRRGLTAILILVIGGMIGGAYLSGMEKRVEALKPAEAEAPKLEGENKQFVQFWGAFWVVVVVLVFAVVGLAFTDALATRRYAMLQYRTIREDHEVKLRRDLAVYVAQKQAGQRAGRMGNRTNDDSETND
jgi:hypothetical protein